MDEVTRVGYLYRPQDLNFYRADFPRLVGRLNSLVCGQDVDEFNIRSYMDKKFANNADEFFRTKPLQAGACVAGASFVVSAIAALNIVNSPFGTIEEMLATFMLACVLMVILTGLLLVGIYFSRKNGVYVDRFYDQDDLIKKVLSSKVRTLTEEEWSLARRVPDSKWTELRSTLLSVESIRRSKETSYAQSNPSELEALNSRELAFLDYAHSLVSESYLPA